MIPAESESAMIDRARDDDKSRPAIKRGRAPFYAGPRRGTRVRWQTGERRAVSRTVPHINRRVRYVRVV